MIKSSLTAVGSESSINTLAICYTTCHSAVIGKISTKKRWSDNMPAWDVSLSRSHSLLPFSTSLYLDPGDEQEKVCSICEKHTWKNTELWAWLDILNKSSFLCPFYVSILVTIGALYHQRALSANCKQLPCVPCMYCSSGENPTSCLIQQRLCQIKYIAWIVHESYRPAGFFWDMLYFIVKCHCLHT